MDAITRSKFIDGLRYYKNGDLTLEETLRGFEKVLKEHYIQGEDENRFIPDTDKNIQLDLLVIRKIVGAIQEKENMHREKFKEFHKSTGNVMNGHWVKADTCKEIIEIIKNNFNV